MGATRLLRPIRRMDPEVELRREMLREAERVLDHEVAAIEQLDQKTSHALTLTISGFSLLVLLATLSPTDPTTASLLLLGAGGAANALAALLLTKEYHLEPDAGVHVGPDPAWLRAAADVGVQEMEYLDLVLLGFAEYHRHNAVHGGDEGEAPPCRARPPAGRRAVRRGGAARRGENLIIAGGDIRCS